MVSAVANSQIIPPEPTNPQHPPTAPIDGSLFLLLIAGLAFGVFTIYKYKLKTKASM